jgi:hypothetical protein
MATELKDFLLQLMQDHALWKDFTASPARAKAIAAQHNVVLADDRIGQFITGMRGFSSLLTLAQHHFAIHVQLFIELAGSGHVGPGPGNPHMDKYVIDMGPSEAMIAGALR